ncbi:hypothetical protein VIAQ111709_16210 [Vibrio aquimaris]|uniref:Uncharacterized protein n=1 Tax=Vibrio aquimaris TaxID=2587862 RepID=A0A5P9CSF3_9VIBR|nr:hypothetical protein FIV01_19720 [Vibrio aquimaris]
MLCQTVLVAKIVNLWALPALAHEVFGVKIKAEQDWLELQG